MAGDRAHQSLIRPPMLTSSVSACGAAGPVAADAGRGRRDARARNARRRRRGPQASSRLRTAACGPDVAPDVLPTATVGALAGSRCSARRPRVGGCPHRRWALVSPVGEDPPGGREAPVASEGPPDRVRFKGSPDAERAHPPAMARRQAAVKLANLPAGGVGGPRPDRGAVRGSRCRWTTRPRPREPSSGLGGRTRGSEAPGQAGSTSNVARLRASLLNSTPIR